MHIKKHGEHVKRQGEHRHIKELFGKRKLATYLASGALMATFGLGGVALAWVTDTGAGTGHANGPSDPVPVTLSGHTFNITSLTCTGACIYSVPFTSTNTNNYKVNIGDVTVTAIAGTKAGTKNCSSGTNPTWFTLTAATTPTIAPRGMKSYTHPGYTATLPHISINTVDATQASCVGATFTLTLSAPGAGPVLTTTTTVLSASPLTQTKGDDVTFTATVTPTTGGGSVDFTDNGSPFPAGTDCSNTTSNLTHVSGTEWERVCSTSEVVIGTNTVTATYSGHGTYAGSTSNTVKVTVTA